MHEERLPENAHALPSCLADCPDLWGHLVPASQRALATAAWLAQTIPPGGSHLDWSPVVTLTFKALEFELLVRVLQPFREYFHHHFVPEKATALVERLKGEEWYRPLGRFLGGSHAPTLTATATYLGGLKRVAADTPDHILALLKRWLRHRFPLAHRLWGPRGVARKVEQAMMDYRNPFTHARVADAPAAARALDQIWGRPAHAGVLVQALRLLTPGLPPPHPTTKTCDRCGRGLWAYPRRFPESHCATCPRVWEPLDLSRRG